MQASYDIVFHKSGPPAQLTEPPHADPHVQWSSRGRAGEHPYAGF
jgi:hypothetical protein